MKTDIFRTEKKYQIIYADPPWDYRESGSAKNARGLAKLHYRTMTVEDVCALPVPEIKTEDAVCFLWATFPKISQALKVMEAWGFEYKTAAFVWVKENRKAESLFWGMGAWTRANAEVCLLGISKKTKAGQCVKSHKVHQIIKAPVESHSKKPDEAGRRITELLGDLPRIELFARQQTAGWDCWGDEV